MLFTGLIDVGNSLFVRLLNSIGEVTRSQWNALLGSCDADGLMISDEGTSQTSPPSVDSLSAICPFLHYDWIRALEESGCASTRAGMSYLLPCGEGRSHRILRAKYDRLAASPYAGILPF